MKKTSERFDRAIQALVSAFLNGTLAKGDCSACAVGNIVAGGIGGVISYDPEAWEEFSCTKNNREWANVFVTNWSTQEVSPEQYVGKAKANIDATGYSWQELAKVEKVFESNTKINFLLYKGLTPAEIDADQYAGLSAVFDVLCEIEGIGDASAYKALLSKPQAIPV